MRDARSHDLLSPRGGQGDPRVLGERGITGIAQLNSFKGRALLDVPLWKLLGTQGKYGGQYISEGVRTLELKLGRLVNKSYCVWPEKLLQQHFGPPHVGWSQFRRAP